MLSKHSQQILKTKRKRNTYRILFNFTPIRPTLKHYPFCKNKQIGEEHLFTKCSALNMITNSLQDTIQQLTGKEINIHKSIMLNIFPRTHKNNKPTHRTLIRNIPFNNLELLLHSTTSKQQTTPRTNITYMGKQTKLHNTTTHRIKINFKS